MAQRQHEKFITDSDSDSAISSEGTQDSACSCDSCMCDDVSFSSSCDSILGSPINPFGSFKHTGALPYSMFEDSSSFSCSRVNYTEITEDSSDCTFQNSTHIYINLVDRTATSQMQTTRYVRNLEDESLSMTSRPECEGKEDPTHFLDDTITELNCHVRRADSKVGPWLQSCTFSDQTSDDELTDDAQTSDTSTYAQRDLSADSDATAFLEQSLVRHGAVTHKPSSKKRHCLAKKLCKVGKKMLKAFAVV